MRCIDVRGATPVFYQLGLTSLTRSKEQELEVAEIKALQVVVLRV